MITKSMITQTNNYAISRQINIHKKWHRKMTTWVLTAFVQIEGHGQRFFYTYCDEEYILEARDSLRSTIIDFAVGYFAGREDQYEQCN